MSIDRRDFLKAATAGAGLAATGAGLGASEAAAEPLPKRIEAPFVRIGQVPDVVVVGAGNFGAWTALNLRRGGADVLLLDQYGPANSRSASGGETRGVRSSYGGRETGMQWARWAIRALQKWKDWDEQYTDAMLPRLFYETGDLIMREELDPSMEQSMANWDELGHAYEVLTPEEVRYRWPMIRTPGIGAAMYEPSAGVVRARRAIESVARVFEQEGGRILIAKAQHGDEDGRTLQNVHLQNGDKLEAGLFVYATGAWFHLFLPELLGQRFSARAVGHVYYFSTPPGDDAYQWPNCPSYGVPGCTGWPALPGDFRGFRIRTGGDRSDDPDNSVRWIPEERHARPREILADFFPALADRVINETRACHYSSTVSRNFIIDTHPDLDNVWLAGGGQAESFKQGPVLGEYIAGRIFGIETDEELNDSFRLLEATFEEGQEDLDLE
ncbi:MAG: FAD-binding oxidoreductase [Gemmatimonadota bacterium]|nr:FAD-binding oxidoreductase [Gemmatimonadota bacterium]